MQSITIGTHVRIIDRNGEIALGHVQAYRKETDDYEVTYILRKPEVRVTTDPALGITNLGRSGFGGNPININPEIMVEGACHVSDPRAGQPRFIFVDEDEGLLNPPLTQDQKQSGEATAEMLNPPPGVTQGQGGQNATSMPDVSVGAVVEAEARPEPHHKHKQQ